MTEKRNSKDPREGQDPEEFLDRYPAFKNKIENLFKAMGPDGGVPTAENPQAGRVVGDFRILKEIGSGGMATVYEAEQISLKRRVALKVLAPSLSLQDRAVRKFYREAEAGGRQAHAGIVSIYAVGEDRGIHYIAQELVPGGFNLADRLAALRREETLPMGYFREAAEQLLDVAQALQYAHSSGVIHRDVKPSNILLDADGRPKVSDFGLARIEDALTLSRTGDFAGTPFYMSPEQALGKRTAIDPRTDVFSLGVTLYESLTLIRPFDGETSHDVIRKIIHYEPRHLVSVNARVPRDLAVICLKALEKSPADRYPTMEAFAEDLRRFLANEPILAKPTGWIGRSGRWLRRHKLLSFAGVASLIALLITAILFHVVSQQQQAAYFTAMDRFRPLEEAFEFRNLYSDYKAGAWCLYADPTCPHAAMLSALCKIKRGDLKEASTTLDICVSECRLPEDRSLQQDAHYLLGFVLCEAAQKTEHSPEVQSLLASAREQFALAGHPDPAATDRFLLHTEDAQEALSGRISLNEYSFQVNENHFLVHLYLGTKLFDNLYKGGDIVKFEQAIKHFERVLQERPNFLPALIYLGRVYFFFARFYRFLELTTEAENLLHRALTLSGEEPYNLIFITLGQIYLLRRNNEEALTQFRRALEYPRKMDVSLHNAYRGLARIFARQNKIPEAREAFLKTAEIQPDDPNLNAALAEFDLQNGDLDQALIHARQGKRYSVRRSTLRRETFVAAGHLVLARTFLNKQEYRQAEEHLEELFDISIHSPRDLALACVLMATFPETYIEGERGATFKHLARAIALDINRGARFNDRTAPVALVAQGISLYLNGDDAQAVAYLAQAMTERTRWPDSAGASLTYGNARDLYMIAMAQYRGEIKDEAGALLWPDSLERAESLYRTVNPYFEKADILNRVRDKALAVLPGR